MICKHAIVLLKVVRDPDGAFQIGADGQVTGEHLPQVPSIFDENALEAAIQIKEVTGCKITVACLGDDSHEQFLKRALAMGADEIVLIANSESSWDSVGTAAILAAALKHLDPPDIVLCGQEAADTGAGLVGPYVAQTLGIPFLTLAKEISVTEGGLLVKRPCEGAGYDVFLCQPPFLISVMGEANRPRMASMRNTLQARKIPARRIDADSLDAMSYPAPAFAHVVSRGISQPGGACTFIEGGSVQEIVDVLLGKLRDERVIG